MKSLFGKFKGKKAPEQEESPALIKHEMAVGSTTVVEPTPDLDKVPGTECGIEIFVNNEKTNFYPITTDTRIGRDPAQSDISIPELIVSKSHCALYFKDNNVYIKDTGSTNGTFVNGRQVSDHLLQDNDMISLGRKGTVRIIFSRRAS